jgi:hypothetical protein
MFFVYWETGCHDERGVHDFLTRQTAEAFIKEKKRTYNFPDDLTFAIISGEVVSDANGIIEHDRDF